MEDFCAKHLFVEVTSLEEHDEYLESLPLVQYVPNEQ